MKKEKTAFKTSKLAWQVFTLENEKLQSFSILNIQLCQHLLLQKVTFKTKIINPLLDWPSKHQSSPTTMPACLQHTDSSGPSLKSTFTYAPSSSRRKQTNKLITKARDYQDEGEIISNLGKILRKSTESSIFCVNCANLKIWNVWTGWNAWTGNRLNTEAPTQNRFSNVRTSCPGNWLSSHPWRSLKVHVALQDMV